MTTEYDLLTQGARAAPPPAYDGRDPDRNKPLQRECHDTCDVCFSPAGDKWPCAKAVATKARTVTLTALWLAMDADGVVIFGGKSREATNQFINDHMCDGGKLLRMVKAVTAKDI